MPKSIPIRLRGYEGILNVVPVAAAPTAHVAYHAAQPDKPCRVSKTPAACWVDAPKGTRMPKPWTKLDKSETQKREACERAGGVFTGTAKKKNRAGKLELEFLSPGQAADMKTRPGPNLRLCFADGTPGRLVPVASPADADRVRRAFEACVAGKRGRMRACAARVAGADAPLGSPPRARLMDRLRR